MATERANIVAKEDAFLIDRVFSYYGSVPQFFFMLAHLGQSKMVSDLANILDVNAVDCDGETALDFAEQSDDSRARDILTACGANIRGRYLIGSAMIDRALYSLRTGQYWGRKSAENVLIEALSNGLNPNATFQVGLSQGFVATGTIIKDINFPGSFECQEDYYEWSDLNHESYEFKNIRHTTTVLLEALYAGSSNVVDKCISIGIRSDVEILARYGSILRKKCIKGETEEVNTAELVVPEEWAKTTTIESFIRSAAGRKEFPNDELVQKGSQKFQFVCTAQSLKLNTLKKYCKYR